MGASWTSWEFCLFFFSFWKQKLLHFEQPIKLKNRKTKTLPIFKAVVKQKKMNGTLEKEIRWTCISMAVLV